MSTAATEATVDGEGTPAVAAVPGAVRTRRPKETIRYTLDLSKAQHRFLKVFALDNDVEASKIVRALLGLLEDDEDLRSRVSVALDGDADPE